MTGWNTDGFDLPYLINRAAALGIDREFSELGRIPGVTSDVRETIFSSRQSGSRKQTFVNLPGRVRMDLLPVIRRDHKLPSYKLNNVAYHFLKQRKEDVHYSSIAILHSGSSSDRAILASYCLKDALLPMLLMQKLCIVENIIALARVTGIPIEAVIVRGQQIRTFTLLVRYAKQYGFLIPTIERADEDEPDHGHNEIANYVDERERHVTYEGASVLTPKQGYYKDPIVTLDFHALYPSIMIANNLSYETLCEDSLRSETQPPILIPAIDADQKTGTKPVYFVKKSIRKGLLPMILEELLIARKQAKQHQKEEPIPAKKAIWNGRQLALKLIANSIYGFTGFVLGMLPCIDISATVTTIGREMILKTKNLIEEHFTVSRGYQHDAVVVYGDTDSVMVWFGSMTMQEAFRLGMEASRLTNKLFPPPNDLELEKVYKPFLLFAKKRYAAQMWTKPDHPKCLDIKGLETVRRDNCALVRDTMQECLHYILEKEDEQAAIRHVQQILADLLQDKVDLSRLIITQSLTKEHYKSKPPHVELMKRLQQRDPGSAPQLGDRVPYVICRVATRHRVAKVYEQAEDPLHALENNIPINTTYYVNCLRKVLTRLFEPIVANPESTLFQGSHMRKHVVVLSRKSPLSQFLVTMPRCLECSATLTGASQPGKALCARCNTNVVEIHRRWQQKVVEARREEQHYWEECIACQHTLSKAKVCCNKDCPNLYKRAKAGIQMEQLNKQLERFQF